MDRSCRSQRVPTMGPGASTPAGGGRGTGLQRASQVRLIGATARTVGACSRQQSAGIRRRLAPSASRPSVDPFGLPQLDGIALGIMHACEPTVGVVLRIDIHSDPAAAQLTDHLIKVANSKVNRPGLLRSSEMLGVRWKRGEHGRSWLLPPRWPVIGVGSRIDAEPLGVPATQRFRVACTEEQAADPRHSLHSAPLQICGTIASIVRYGCSASGKMRPSRRNGGRHSGVPK